MKTKAVAIQDFLTPDEIRKVCLLKTAKLIKEQVVEPNLERINKAIGQENDPMYLAYALEYVVSQITHK